VKFGVAACSLFVLAASNDAVADGFYVYGNVGLQFISDEEENGVEVSYDTGFSGGGGVGYDIGPVSLEILAEFGAADYDQIDGSNASGDVSWFAVIPTVYFNWREYDVLMPRAGFGVGYIDVHSDDAENEEFIFLDNSEDYVVYKGSLGLLYSINDSLEVGPHYRLRLVDEVDFDEVIHAAEIGFFYKF